MNIIYFHQKSRMCAGSILGVVTFGLGTLMGLPYARIISDVEIEATFYNTGDQLLGVYRGVGRGNTAESVFRTGTARITHQKAMRNALEDLNAKIMGDSILLATLHP